MYVKAIQAGSSFYAVIPDLSIQAGMGGAEVMERLLTLDPKVGRIVCSGSLGHPVLTRLKDYGFKAAAAKRFGIEDMKRALNRLARE